ncbi:MAG: tetraacyldisaccharide 4'-kinase [Pseudomonadota bacterium]
MAETPPFWYAPANVQAWLMSPVAKLYGLITARRMMREAHHRSSLPVLCVGNLVAGGAGKTPTCIALAEIVENAGRQPLFLTRGHGGALAGPVLVDLQTHNAHDVGDEALLLARHAPTIVARDRAAGAMALEQKFTGGDRQGFVIMDDGFQNPGLHKDFCLVVIDGRRGVGNGFVHPAGPLRAPLAIQMRAADAVLVIGDGDAGAKVLRLAARRGCPTQIAALAPATSLKLRGVSVLAWAGIGDPEKFYQTVRSMGADVKATKDFDDHHFVSAEEARDLLDDASRQKLSLVTTEKDMVRILAAHDADVAALAEHSTAVPVKLAPDNAAAFGEFVPQTLRAFKRRMNRASDG